ncbi:MAG: hypothetical protein ABEH64_02335 [Salinirussus sp.]
MPEPPTAYVRVHVIRSHTMTPPTKAPEETTDGDGRYGSIETRDGETIIYDRETPDAWVQSDLLLECES